MPRKPPLHKRVRIADVAHNAGVSTATVSRVINETVPVPSETRERVLRAIRETGFVRNALAGQLAGGSSGAIGIVVPTLTNPVFADSIQAIITSAEKQRTVVFVGTHEYSHLREVELIRRFLEWRVDGLLLTGAVRAPEAETIIAASRCPSVVMWEFAKRRGQHTVSFDNVAAARKMVEYLVSLGHERIAFISPSTHYNDRSGGRREGYRQALAQHGLPADERLIVESTTFGLGSGRECMAHLLAMTPRPTAVFCGNDLLAAGAILECMDRGIAVPDSMTIVGFDDIELSRNLRPGITTVRVPTQQMSIAAVTALQKLIGGRRVANELFDVEIVVRGSSAPPERKKSGGRRKMDAIG